MLQQVRTVARGLERKLSFSWQRLTAFLVGHPAIGRRLAGGLAVMAAGIGGLLLYAVLLIPFTPAIPDIRKARIERPTLLVSADGRELATFRRLNREWVPLSRLPRHLVDALIATEDRCFYEHHGIDFRRTAIAGVMTLFGRRQGGSTITQQLARNLFPDEVGRAPTVTRKLKEMVTAIKLEYAYTKPQILETYFNTVPFLYNANGIEMAARTYFNTSASRLSVGEAATLVGMLKGTAYYNPVLKPERALERRNLVLSLMVQAGTLRPESYETLRRQPLGVDFEIQKAETGLAPHFSEQVKRWLVDWAGREGYDIYADGLVVHTTLDSQLQRLANRVVAREMEALQTVAEVEWGQGSERLLSTRLADYTDARRRVVPFGHYWRSNPELVENFLQESSDYTRLKSQGASHREAVEQLMADPAFMAALRARKTRLEAGFVAVDPATGAVRAWVGSRDFDQDRYDHVAQARRQPGSTFKPFVYAAALEAGMRTDQAFVDQPVAIRLPDGGLWKPGDLGGNSGEVMTLEDGLVYSKNSITAQVMERVGPKRVAQVARQAGVRTSVLDPVPSLALGTSPVTLLEMVAAYGTFAGLGEYKAPLLVARVTDRHGRVLARFEADREKALTRTTAIQVIDMLRGAVDRGTGRGLRRLFGISADVAGKTGTTQNNTDGWFILMHPQLVAGAWVGFNDPRVRMRSDYWGQGAHNALYLVGDFYRQALAVHALDADMEFPLPEGRDTFGAGLDRVGNWFREMLGLEKTVPRRPRPWRGDAPRADGRPDPVDSP